MAVQPALVQLYLVSLLTAGDGAGERFLLSPVHAHGAEDGLRANGTFCGPRFIAVWLLIVYLLLIILTAWRHSRDTHNKKYASHPRWNMYEDIPCSTSRHGNLPNRNDMWLLFFEKFNACIFCSWFITSPHHWKHCLDSTGVNICLCFCVCLWVKTQGLAQRRRSLSGSDPHCSAWKKKCFAECRTFSIHMHAHSNTYTHRPSHTMLLTCSRTHKKRPTGPPTHTSTPISQEVLHLSMMAPWHMSKEGACMWVCVLRLRAMFGAVWAGIGHLLLGCATHGPMLTHSVTAAM